MLGRSAASGRGGAAEEDKAAAQRSVDETMSMERHRAAWVSAGSIFVGVDNAVMRMDDLEAMNARGVCLILVLAV